MNCIYCDQLTNKIEGKYHGYYECPSCSKVPIYVMQRFEENQFFICFICHLKNDWYEVMMEIGKSTHIFKLVKEEQACGETIFLRDSIAAPVIALDFSPLLTPQNIQQKLSNYLIFL